MTLRVCIADDHLLMLHGARDALMRSPDIEIVGLTHVGAEVVELVETQAPGVLLLDQHMPGVDTLECVREIKRRWPAIHVIMLSACEDPRVIAEALAAGAGAYVGKRINPDDLASVLRQVVAGVVHQRSVSEQEPAAAVATADAAVLTARERTILEHVAGGASTKVISRELWVSEKTVKFHLTNIYRKLDVHNRTGAMRYAYEHGLIARAPAQALTG